MNSAMNIEFVYLILVGINNFMDNELQSKHTRRPSTVSNVEQ